MCIDIREAVTPGQINAHIDIQLAAYHVPRETIDHLRPLRRHWWTIPHLKFYLAYAGETPPAQAILDCRDGIAVPGLGRHAPDWRQRGFQSALIRRRLTDAQINGLPGCLWRSGLREQQPHQSNGLRVAGRLYRGLVVPAERQSSAGLTASSPRFVPRPAGRWSHRARQRECRRQRLIAAAGSWRSCRAAYLPPAR